MPLKLQGCGKGGNCPPPPPPPPPRHFCWVRDWGKNFMSSHVTVHTMSYYWHEGRGQIAPTFLDRCERIQIRYFPQTKICPYSWLGLLSGARVRARGARTIGQGLGLEVRRPSPSLRVLIWGAHLCSLKP